MSLLLQAAILGIVQGATEFLPVSSSAHLILARAFFGFDGDKFGLPFDVACHVGTLIAVLIYFRDDVMRMVAAVPALVRADVFGPPKPGSDVRTAHVQRAPGPPARVRTADVPPVDLRTADVRRSASDAASGFKIENVQDYARLIWLLVVGTIPAVIVGLLFNKVIEERMRTPEVAAIALAIGGILFFVAERVGDHQRSDQSLTFLEAFWIGCAQALALIPGVSRSGATITIALLLGLRRPDAARFIFLLAIPAIVAAAGKEAPKMLKAGIAGDQASLFLIGIVMSAIVGYLAVKFFVQYLQKHTLDVFGWYRLALAASVAVWLFIR
jgi:undecaprenyl-diphosphatase